MTSKGNTMKGTKDMILTEFSTKKLSSHDNTPLKVEPSIVKFKSINQNTLYVMTFAVRNNTQVANRIRISSPNSKYFALNYIPSGAVAPGLDVRAEIECQLPDDFPNTFFFTDTITATMGPYSIDIPLYASRPAADIVFDPLINFGCIGEGQVHNIDVLFKNQGEITGTVDFKLKPDSGLKATPSSFDLNPGEKIKVQMELDASDFGPYRDLVHCAVSNSCIDSFILDVNAQIVNQKLTLLAANHGGSLEVVNFGPLYYGQSKSVSAVLLNTGPQQLSFSISYADEEENSKVTTGGAPQTEADPSDSGSFSIAKFMTITPSDGVVKPFSEIPISFKFNPEQPLPGKGFLKQFEADSRELKIVNRRAFIDSVEIGHRIGVSLSASTAFPQIQIKPNLLNFGYCPVSDRRDILFSISNNSHMATTFDFPKTAQFKIVPNKGTLDAQQTKTLVATFQPAQLGKHKTNIKVSIANGLHTVEFKMVAESDDVGVKKVLVGGSAQLPEDFKVQYKFVDPDKVKTERREHKEKEELRKSLYQSKTHAASIDNSIVDESDEISYNSQKEMAEVYGLTSHSSADDVLDKSHPTMLRKKNNQIFNDYLQQSHAERLEDRRDRHREKLYKRGQLDREDPYGVDMGMERGLDEPEFKPMAIGEPLWLANRPGGASGRSKLPTDENRLIQKKFTDQPSTQAELRDCSSELNSDDQKYVIASHKTLDFGRACINSVVAKNFVVTNDLEHSVLISLTGLEPELKQSRPEAQVVPAGATAGFDIYFSSKTLGSYRKTFTWTINGKHIYKVVTVAEVVPIELVMNKHDIVMEFGASSLETYLTQDLVLSNPGNAPAEFLWGNSGAFECRPDKGSISPGTSSIITIVWTPSSGKRNEEELGLHITGGIDQTLKVVGVLEEAKAHFIEKVLTLGTIAVGAEKVVEANIKNTGTCPAVFYIDPIDERYGITTTMKRGLVPPGEVIPIQFTVNARSAMSYDNMKITATLRGGKPMLLKLSAESVVPTFEFLEEKISIGPVAVGSEFRTPITLVNRTSIAASLILDLSKYPDFQPCIHRRVSEESIEFMPIIQDDDFGNRIDFIPAKPVKKNSIIDEQNGESPLVDNKKPLKAAKDGQKSSKDNNKWKLTLAAGATMSAFLVFAPSSPKVYNFKLPMYLQGIEQDTSFARELTATASVSRLKISNFLVDFGDRVVTRDPMSRASYFLEISFTNMDKIPISYEVQESGKPVEETKKKGKGSDDVPPLFFVAPTKGSLVAGASCPVRISFSPQNAGNYNKKLEVYISGQPDTTRPYLTISCKGSGVFPRLSFSTQSLDLPVVPLGMTTRGFFTVINNGYSSLELKYRVSPTISLPLEISFPDGEELSSTRDRIRVLVCTKSDAPISWNGNIDFFDTDGEKFSIMITGCSDSCLFTNYNFLNAYSKSYTYVGLENQPVYFKTKAEAVEMKAEDVRRKEKLRKQRALDRQKQADKAKGGDVATKKEKTSKKSGSVASKNSLEEDSTSRTVFDEGIDIEANDTNAMLCNFNDKEAKMLLKWLNRFVCRKPFVVEQFPECIVESHGDLFVDCVEQMSGRKISGIKPGQAEGCDGSAISFRRVEGKTALEIKTATALRLASKYKVILTFLIKSGGLLAHINPMVLLSRDDYLFAQEAELKRLEGARLTPAMLNDRKQSWEEQHELRNKLAWLDLLFQSIKIFNLSRVTYKDYCQLPGVIISNTDEPEGKSKNKKPTLPAEYSPSNCFSQAEAVLLSWASFHTQHANNMRDDGAGDDKVETKLLGLSKRMVDVETEFADLFSFCQIFHSHLPDSTIKDGPLHGYTTLDKSKKDVTFQTFRKVLDLCRLSFEEDIEDITASGRTILLMLLHLYLNLPSLIPKTKIEFKGTLGVPIAKSIELRNPSKKKVTYNVSLQGSSDFCIDNTELVLPPESMVDFPVTLRAKFSQSTTAVITFAGVREAGVAGATMVFQLASVITGRKPLEITKRFVNLFDYDSFQIPINNPYPKDCTFPVTLVIKSFNPLSVTDAIKGKEATHGKGGTGGGLLPPPPPNLLDEISAEDAERQEVEQMYKVPFWCNDDHITMLAKGSRFLTIHFLPFMIGYYSCEIAFIEPSLGEFCYEVVANVGLPRPVDKVEFVATLAKTQHPIKKALRLSSKNNAFEKAVGTVLDLRLNNPNKKTKARAVMQNFLNSPCTDESTGQSSFFMEIPSNYFNCPRGINLVSDYLTTSGKSTPGLGETKTTSKFKKISKTIIENCLPAELGLPGNSLNTAIISFVTDKAGQYQSRAIAYSKDNKNDIRVLEIVSNVTMPDTKMGIEFRGAARQNLSQEIPIQNDSDLDWNLTTTITGKGFSGEKSFVVAKHSRSVYNLKFFGSFEGQFDGVLDFKNFETNDVFGYILTGYCNEPLAEEHFVFHCKARTKQKFSIPLHQLVKPPLPFMKGQPPPPVKKGETKEPQTFNVQTDLPYLMGPTEISIKEEGGSYQFYVNSPVGGLMSGSITFTDPESGSLMWYTVDIEVTAPEAESTIQVESVVRKAVSLEILLDNPTTETLLFNVSYSGDGLFGDEKFYLPPGESDIHYELIYSPLISGNYNGRINFTNDTVGEFWYRLALTALAAPPTVVECIECIVGTSRTIQVPIENPLPEVVTLTASISNSNHFLVNPEEITLSPYAQSSFNLQFKPDTLNELAECDIYFTHPSFGQVHFQVSGMGQLPGTMPLVNVFSPLNTLMSHSIMFRNPFNHPLPIGIILTDGLSVGIQPPEEQENSLDSPFSLLIRKSNEIVIPAKSPFQISLSFCPLRLGQYDATVQVRSAIQGRNLNWCFPILGMADAGTPQSVPRLTTQCKTSLVNEIDVKLDGIRPSEITKGKELSLRSFTQEITVDAKYSVLVNRSFRAQAIELVEHVDPETLEPTDSFILRYRLLFEPLRTFVAPAELIVMSKGYGRWKVLLDLEATDPDPDDIIRLTAAVNSTDKITFRLTNRFLGFSQFQAYFSARSSSHFTISPPIGVLAPYGSDGTPFVVTFSPTEYGSREIAHLVIVTDDTQWNYEIIGTYPEFNVNTLEIKSKIDTGKR
jgi:hypothetical protein